jgi:hypothetical protein
MKQAGDEPESKDRFESDDLEEDFDNALSGNAPIRFTLPAGDNIYNPFDAAPGKI